MDPLAAATAAAVPVPAFPPAGQPLTAPLIGDGPSEEHETTSIMCGDDFGVFKGTC